jgi:hypothetical protein
MLKAYWAYDFACEQSLDAIAAAFNAAGPWQWQLRESAVYGDYLNCRPMERVRLRVHEYPQTGEYGTFRRLLQAINATDVTEIEPYD